MTRDELMTMAASKAAQELTQESIDFLFRPSTLFELLLRSDFDGTVKVFYEAMADDSPAAMPHRFRDGPYRLGKHMIDVERFYRAIKEAKLNT